MKLAKIKTKYMSILLQVKEELIQKYPDRKERIEQIADILMHKLYTLKSHSLADYMHIVYLASKEFPEFLRVMPTKEEVEEVLKGG